MRLLRQFQAYLFFLYKKILNAQKCKSSKKPTSKTKTSKQKTTKATVFHAQKLLRGGK